MRLRALVLVAAALTACGTPQHLEVKKATPQMHSSFSAWATGDAALQLSRYRLALFAAAVSAVQPEPAPASPEVAPPDLPPAAASPWPCIAEAETGSDWTMHGSTYSTAFGMVNDIIEDYGSPEQQAAVFSGTASPETQIDIASRFAADHGFGGWGELTKQKCGL